MIDLELSPEHFEVLAAIAETGGIDSGFPAVLEVVEPAILSWMVKRAQDVINFRNRVICEGNPTPESISTKEVTKSLISLEYDQNRIETTKIDLGDLANRHPSKRVSPATLLFQALFPDRHRIIELTQISSDASSLAGLDSHLRMQRLLDLHPRNQTQP